MLLILSVIACAGLCAGPAAHAAVPVVKKRTVCKKRVVRTASGKKKTVKRCWKVKVATRTATVPVAEEPAAPAPKLPDVPAPGGIRAELRECANSERAKVGLGPLADNPALDAAAQAHVQDMKARGYFAHESLDGKSPFDRIDGVFATLGVRNLFTAMGENIAKGFSDAVSTCKAWMESPGHRANILRPQFDSIGTGWIDGYASQEFGGS